MTFLNSIIFTKYENSAHLKEEKKNTKSKNFYLFRNYNFVKNGKANIKLYTPSVIPPQAF